MTVAAERTREWVQIRFHVCSRRVVLITLWHENRCIRHPGARIEKGLGNGKQRRYYTLIVISTCPFFRTSRLEYFLDSFMGARCSRSAWTVGSVNNSRHKTQPGMRWEATIVASLQLWLSDHPFRTRRCAWYLSATSVTLQHKASNALRSEVIFLVVGRVVLVHFRVAQGPLNVNSKPAFENLVAFCNSCSGQRCCRKRHIFSYCVENALHSSLEI